MLIAGLIFIQATLALTHYFIYKTAVFFFGLSTPLWSKILFAILSVSFVAVTFLTYRWHGPLARAAYTAGAVWLGTVYWLFIASIFAWAVYGVAKLASPGSNVVTIGAALLIVAVLTSVYGVWNSYQTKIQHVTVRLNNLPSQWKGKRAVLIADTHYGSVRNVRFANKVASTVSSLQPDIVFIAGDFYDGPPVDAAAIAAPFGKITSRHGVYFAAGNHEEYGALTPFMDALTGVGVHVLDNKLMVVDGLQVAGVNYLSTNRAETKRTVLQSLAINPAIASILIKHVPANIEVTEEAGIGLQVSGHTHLGQVFPISLITKVMYGKYVYGLSRFDKTQVLTTSGVGTWGPPQRVGTTSEIVVITFE